MRESKFNEKFRYASLKRDGHNTTVILGGGQVIVKTRTGIDITPKVSWCKWYKNLESYAAQELTFYGELWIPGHGATYVPTAQKQHLPSLKFHVFGCGHVEEGEPLETVRDEARAVGLETIPFWEFSSRSWKPWEGKKDVEGFVFSDGNMRRQAKLKPMKTCDLVVIGYTAGEGKYAGLIGSLIVGTYAGEILATCSGMTDALRYEITFHQDKYLGKVCEVQYQSVGDGGRLRHPVFRGFRDDKPARECTINQIR